MNFLGYSIHCACTVVPIYEFCLISERELTTLEIRGNSRTIFNLRDNYWEATVYVKNINNSFDCDYNTPFRANGPLVPVNSVQFKNIRIQELVPILISKSAKGRPACRRCTVAGRKSENCARTLALELMHFVNVNL